MHGIVYSLLNGMISEFVSKIISHQYRFSLCAAKVGVMSVRTFEITLQLSYIKVAVQQSMAELWLTAIPEAGGLHCSLYWL